MTELKQDLALAIRRLARAPGLTALVIVTLAVGIGITTAVFAMVHAVALRPLPFPEPDRLVVLWETEADGSSLGGAAYLNFFDWQKRARGFAHLGFQRQDTFTLRGREGVERVPGAWVSAGYFPALGVEPWLGRTFTPREADAPGGARVAILGYELFQRRFGGDRRALGRTIVLNQVPLTIVGILPPGFRGFDEAAEVFVPVPLFHLLTPSLKRIDILGDRGVEWGRIVGRLAPGTDLPVARQEMQRVAAGLAAINRRKGADLANAEEILVGDLRPNLLRLLGAAGLVLLIACANVGHLLLTRAAGRDREMAVRAALGATRGRIARHWLAEGALLGLAGGAAGLIAAAWILDLLLAFIPLEIPVSIEIGISGPVLAFALGITLLGSALAALAPAIHGARPTLADSLKQGGRGATESPSSRRSRSLLVTADVAMALLLLIGAGLMFRSVDRIRKIDPGFRSDGILTLSFEPPQSLPAAERLRVKRQVLHAVSALPGVRSAALTSHVPFDSAPLIMGVQVEGVRVEGVRVEGAPAGSPAQVSYISSGYFRTLAIPLEAGRDFRPEDHRLPVQVAIVNRTFAERGWPGGDPLDGRISGLFDPERPVVRVIGVAGDVRTSIQPGSPPPLPQIYLPNLANPTWGFNLVIATEDDPAALTAQVHWTIRAIHPEIAVHNVARLGERVAGATSDRRFFTGLMGMFAAIALVLAVLGIYGLVASMIQRQSRDIAVRRVLGAGSWEILRLVLVRGLAPVLLGIAVGLAGALVLAGTLSAMLFEVAPLDPATFLLAPLLFAGAALAACLFCSQRALEIEPVAALKGEV
jgi:putative ABC transport system permease protein